MLKQEEIYARKKEASGLVSTQARSLALGFLAIAWALLTAHDEPLRSMAANVNQDLILASALCSVLVLGLDILQYIAVTSFAERAYKLAGKKSNKEGQYDEKSFAYKAHAFFYFAKVWVFIIGSGCVLIIFGCLFIPASKAPPSPGQVAVAPPCAAAPAALPTALPPSSHTTSPLQNPSSQ